MMAERDCTGDWEVNQARAMLDLHLRTDEWLIERHAYYWLKFGEYIDNRWPTNDPFARMIAVECEMDKRGIPIPDKKGPARAPVAHGLREAAMFEVE